MTPPTPTHELVMFDFARSQDTHRGYDKDSNTYTIVISGHYNIHGDTNNIMVNKTEHLDRFKTVLGYVLMAGDRLYLTKPPFIIVRKIPNE